MAWTAPRTWSDNEVVGATIMNTHVRDNENYLLSGKVIGQSTFVGSADDTSTSTSFVDVDATNLTITVTPQSTRVKVTFIFTALASVTNDAEYTIRSIALGADAGNATHGLARSVVGTSMHMTLSAVFTGLTAGASNEFRLRYRIVTSGTAKVANNGYPVHMIAEEC